MKKQTFKWLTDAEHYESFVMLLSQQLKKVGLKNNPTKANFHFRKNFSKKFARHSFDFYGYGNGEKFLAILQQVNWALDDHTDRELLETHHGGFKLRTAYRSALRQHGIKIKG